MREAAEPPVEAVAPAPDEAVKIVVEGYAIALTLEQYAEIALACLRPVLVQSARDEIAKGR